MRRFPSRLTLDRLPAAGGGSTALALIALVAAVAFSACSGDDSSPTAPSSDVEDSGIGSLDIGGDAALIDATVDDAEVGEPQCDGLGCPCSDDRDCSSDYCIRVGTSAERLCSELCVDTCSEEGFDCVLLANDDGDAVNLCIPQAEIYCLPCDRDSDCGSTTSVCAEQLDGTFCAPPCGDGCAAGALCEQVNVSGESFDVCVPEAGVCAACVDEDGDDHGLGVECAGGADCDDGDRSVFEGAPELCDGKDNDCDLNLDEGFEFSRDDANCGGCGVICSAENGTASCHDGSCAVDECDAPWMDCNGDVADGCETDVSDASLCGACAPVGGRPGDACGTCDSGVIACGPDGNGDVVCLDDGGEGLLNACGGCATLEAAPGATCGTCDSGTWECTGLDLVTCPGDLGDDARNACGGCAELTESLGAACGPCSDGEIVCLGINETQCAGFDPDSDEDGVCDADDRCAGSDDALDGDGDGNPDACDPCPADDPDDTDGDGVCESADVCVGGDDGLDADDDAVPDHCDVCSAGDDAEDDDDDGTPDACDCDAAGCDPVAICTESEGGARCACPEGYVGDGTVCTDIDECRDSLDDCSRDAACTNIDGGFVCECNDGFEGDGRSCSDVNECLEGGHDCHPDATCGNTIGSFRCECERGFEGDGRVCVDVDECAEDLDECSINASCTNTRGSYECECFDGYTGDGRGCTDVNECLEGSDDCDENADCSNTSGGFACECSDGWRGDGTTCGDIDECAEGSDACSDDAVCLNSAGSYGCRCLAGFEGDGRACADVDECGRDLDDCSPNADCTNLRGSWACDCRDGWSGDGVECTDIDECNTEPCDENATCSNNDGGFVCSCDDGFVGDGFTCSPDGGTGVDWSGSYDLAPTWSYSCLSGFVSYNFSRATFIDSGLGLEVTGATRSFFSVEPVDMTGGITDPGVFSVEGVLPGDCAEHFTLDGSFTDADTFTATFVFDVVPDGCASDCVDQTLSVTGTRR